VLKSIMLRTTLIAITCSISVASYAIADSPKQINIPAGDLVTGLESLARQADVSLVYQAQRLTGLRTRGVSGNLTPKEAVIQLLEGTKLEVRTDTSTGAMLIEPPRAGSNSNDPAPAASDAVKEGKSNSSRDFHVAQLDQGTNPQPAPVGSDAPASQAGSKAVLEEIIVTAQKRQERLQDVPVPVTSLDAGSLLDSNQVRIQDYYTQIPGLSASLNNSGAANLAIRGITTGDGANPTVAIVIDDVPYGSSTVLGSGAAVPDIDPSELSRVEVLRGPQGTLYGASSIGGLVKFVTVEPSTDGVSGQVQAGLSSVHSGNEAGLSMRGAINLPLNDTMAVRASAFSRRDPGYIDNIETGEKGINRGDADGARLSGMWRPSEDFKLKLSALFQDNRTYGSPNVMVGPGLEGLQQQALRFTGGYDNKIEAYSAIATGNVAGFELTSVSGYSVNSTFLPQDVSSFFGTLTQDKFGVEGTVTLYEADTRKLSQEVRLSKSLGTHLDWLLGAFYTHEKSSVVSPIVAQDSADGVQGGVWSYSNAPSTYSEYAAFTDLTFHLTEQLDLQIGGRESHNDQSYYQVQSGPYVPMFLGFPSPFVQGPVKTRENAFTYLATPSYKLSRDLMVYARLASGYRPGGPNVGGYAFHAPLSYAPDRTQNYEIGLKGGVLDHELSFDASVYRIEWKNIQIVAYDPNTGASYEINGSRARSQGVELSLESKPLQGLTLAAWTAWNNAVLTETFPAPTSVFGSPGDRLPYDARFSGRLSIQQEFPVFKTATGFVGAAESYVGDRVGEFASVFGPPQRQVYPAYAQTDLRAGVKFDSWSINFFGNNLTDKRGQLNGGLNFFPPNAFNYIQPRTVGVAFSKAFGALSTR
jgi:outer membrane receptor protein involved in Fe transport